MKKKVIPCQYLAPYTYPGSLSMLIKDDFSYQDVNAQTTMLPPL